MLFFILFFWALTLAPAPANSTAPAAKATATTQLPKTSKGLFERLHKKVLACAQKNNVKFNKPKAYQAIHLQIAALEATQKPGKSLPAHAVLNAYLKKLVQEKMYNLGATTPEVIKHTNIALRALKNLAQSTQSAQEMVTEAREIIVLIKNVYLPKQPLESAFAFGARELGYSVAAASVAWAGTAWLSNSNRRGDEGKGEQSTPPMIKNKHHNIDGLNIEILHIPCPRQGSMACLRHSYSNTYQILRQLEKSELSSNSSYEEKKAFFTTTNFEFKEEAEIREELREATDYWNKKNLFKIPLNIPYDAVAVQEPAEFYDYFLRNKFFPCDHTYNIPNGFTGNNFFYFGDITGNDGYEDIIKATLIKPLINLENQVGTTTTITKEHLTKAGEDVYFWVHLHFRKRHTDSCKRFLHYNSILHAIKAFHAGKCVVLCDSVGITSKICHVTVNVFIKNDTGDGGCIIHFDSLFFPENPSSKKICDKHTELLVHFYKRKKIIDSICNQNDLIMEWYNQTHAARHKSPAP